MELSFAGLMKLDEQKVARLLQMHLNRVGQDIDDREHEMGKRQIILTLTFEPQKSINNQPTSRVNCSIDCKTKTPIWRTCEYPMRVTKKTRMNGSVQFGFGFNSDIADSLEQSPLPFGDDDAP